MQKRDRSNVRLSEGRSWMVLVTMERDRNPAVEGSVRLGSQIFKEVFRWLSPAVFVLLIIQ